MSKLVESAPAQISPSQQTQKVMAWMDSIGGHVVGQQLAYAGYTPDQIDELTGSDQIAEALASPVDNGARLVPSALNIARAAQDVHNLHDDSAPITERVALFTVGPIISEAIRHLTAARQLRESDLALAAIAERRRPNPVLRWFVGSVVLAQESRQLRQSVFVS